MRRPMSQSHRSRRIPLWIRIASSGSGGIVPEPIVCHRMGVSATGPRHIAQGKSCQDAFAWRPDGSALPACLAVADGHGSADSFRSERGSRFAVEIATEALERYLIAHETSMPSLL